MYDQKRVDRLIREFLRGIITEGEFDRNLVTAYREFRKQKIGDLRDVLSGHPDAQVRRKFHGFAT